MQIAICDDDRIHRMIIRDYIRQYSEKNPDVNITCDLFENAYDLEEIYDFLENRVDELCATYVKQFTQK